LTSTATAGHADRGGGGGRVVGTGGCWSASHRPSAASKASTRASTRRTVASPGGRQTPSTGHGAPPSAARTWHGASATHSPMAVRDLAPASTAHTATPSTPTSGCCGPRRCLGRAHPRGSRAGRDTGQAPGPGMGTDDRRWRRWAAMMWGQARSPILVMGFDNYMIAGNRACSTSIGQLTPASPTRQNGTMPRPWEPPINNLRV